MTDRLIRKQVTWKVAFVKDVCFGHSWIVLLNHVKRLVILIRIGQYPDKGERDKLIIWKSIECRSHRSDSALRITTVESTQREVKPYSKQRIFFCDHFGGNLKRLAGLS